MQLKKFFPRHKGVIALTSGGSVDFTPTDFDSPLSPAQRAYLYRHCGVDVPQVFWRKQIHGDDIIEAAGTAGSAQGCGDADAYMTDEKDLPIAIRTADCVPVFIFDPVHRVIGLAHAGWKGTHKAIAAKTVHRMKARYASRPSDLKIVLGPGIRKCCYRVGKEFYTYFPAHLYRRDGFIYADMMAANRDQLLQAGVPKENIFDSGLCTCCNTNYFSFRRDGPKAGRMISLMMLT
ncbi:MAG: peptidoglycan editing factor PgeF [Candidatus Omnitrophica bacterium]|nr:peptidoglycan editing factor PgeF [Candidatus Omnitrophota bacterium]